jgi:DNA-binding LacI/PurR family transcriptional regulator
VAKVKKPLARLLHALCDAARAKGYGVLTFSAADDDEIGALDDLLRRNAVGGLVLADTHCGDVRPGWLLDLGARFVAFGRPRGVGRPAHSWVDVDGASGTSQAVHHLAELGHSRGGFLGLPEGSGVGDDRIQGWQTAVEASPYRPLAWWHGRAAGSPARPRSGTEGAGAKTDLRPRGSNRKEQDK